MPKTISPQPGATDGAQLSADFLTVSEAAIRLRVHTLTIYRAIKNGRLKATRVNDRIRIAPADLAEYIEGRAK